MKLVYITSKTYPATTADHFFILEMSKAFTKLLKNNFLLVVGNNKSQDLKNIPAYSFGVNIKKGKKAFYFFRLPFFIFSKRFFTADTVFFTNDLYLFQILNFWKKVFHFKYRLVSDWHMLFNGKIEENILKQSDKVITTTKHLKDLILERFEASESKILPVYGGVDMELFEKNIESVTTIRDRLGLPIDAFLVGYVGYYKTMGMSKGIDTMISSLSLISDGSIKMVFVGGREKEIEEYKKLAQEKKVLEKTIFISVVSSESIPLYEKAMDLLVIPYPDQPHFRDYGFPMKAYEYLASKRSVLFSRLSIMEEVLGDCAVSFEPGNEKDLAEKIKELRLNPEKTKDHIIRAYEKAQESTWGKRAENIISFIDKVGE